MRIEITVGHYTKSIPRWKEVFDFPNLDSTCAEDFKEAIKQVQKELRMFNIQRDDDRKLISTKLLGPSQKHVWEKTNLVTICKGGSTYDTAKCKNCGATAKRFGLGSHVVDKAKDKLCTKGK